MFFAAFFKMKKNTFIVIIGIFLLITSAWADDKDSEMSLALSKLEKDKAMEQDLKQAKKQEAVRIAFNDEYSLGEDRLDKFLRYLHPYLEVETKYEDNIYLTTYRKSDIVNTYTPGIKFISLSEDNDLRIDTGAKLTYYYHTWWNNTQNPFANIVWNKKFGRNYIKLSEQFKYDFQASSNISVDTPGFIGYQYNLVDVRVGRELNRFSLEPGYRKQEYFYRKGNKQNNSYNETLWIMTGYYHFTPKTSLLFEYNHGIVVYPLKPTPSKDNKYEQFWFGLKGDITPKINGVMKYGYQFRKFTNRQYLEKPVIGFDLNYQFKERTNFLLKLKKTPDQTSYYDQNYYETSRMDLGIAHKFAFNPKLAFNMDSFYEYDNYPSPQTVAQKKRLDSLFGIKGALKYDLQRWFSVLFCYEWKERDSNTDLYDYVDHIISAKLVGSF